MLFDRLLCVMLGCGYKCNKGIEFGYIQCLAIAITAKI